MVRSGAVALYDNAVKSARDCTVFLKLFEQVMDEHCNDFELMLLYFVIYAALLQIW